MSEPPLTGRVIGVTAERRRAELGDALARQGAEVVYAPAIRVVPLADDTQLLDATRRLVDRPPDVTVTTTAVGFRGWLDVAGEWELQDGLLAALRSSDVLTRGPKVRGAVRAAGLREAWSPESESSDEVFAHIAENYRRDGLRIAVQLHGDPLTDLVGQARGAGSEVLEIPVYRWEPPSDPEPLLALIERVVAGSVDAVTFTSAPAATNFLRTADSTGLDVVAAFNAGVACFAVGPVTAAPLVARGVPVRSPDRHRLGALVQQIVTELPRPAR